MTAYAVSDLVVNEGERTQLVSVIIEKMRQACFVDWVVGSCLFAFYAIRLWNHDALTAGDLYPLIGALAITRVGNTVQKVVADYTYWRFHKQGEVYGNQIQQT